jgi:hypothetical protein
MDFRIGNERRSMIGGDIAVIPGDIEHEGFFSEDTEVVDSSLYACAVIRRLTSAAVG